MLEDGVLAVELALEERPDEQIDVLQQLERDSDDHGDGQNAFGLDGPWRDRPGFEYRARDVMEVLPTQTARDAPVVQAVAAAIENVTGRRPEYVCSPGTYDQKHVVRIGQLEDCIAYGPGLVELAHQPDEYVVIDDLVASAKVMAAAALRLLHVPSA